MEMTSQTRERAQPTGSRVLEMHSGTPNLNDWYYTQLRKHVRGDVLEIGSGIGNISKLLAQDASSLIATDVEDEYVERLRQTFAGQDHVSVELCNLDERLPATIAERRFDTIVSLNVIEHVQDDRAAVRRLAELLRPGGWMLTYVPACAWAYGSMDAGLGHYRRYERSSFRGLMDSAGLITEKIYYFNLLGLLGWYVNGRILHRQLADESQVRLFDRIVPVLRRIERFAPPVGLGLVAHARKPS